MSRSGYSDDGDGCDMNLYRATVDRALAGKRGQLFLQGLAKALDDMPVKRLIAHELVAENGEACAIGAYCQAKGIDTKDVDYEHPSAVGRLVNISSSMAAEIEYENDERIEREETPEQRWTRMRKWVADNLITSEKPK